MQVASVRAQHPQLDIYLTSSRGISVEQQGITNRLNTKPTIEGWIFNRQPKSVMTGLSEIPLLKAQAQPRVLQLFAPTAAYTTSSENQKASIKSWHNRDFLLVLQLVNTHRHGPYICYEQDSHYHILPCHNINYSDPTNITETCKPSACDKCHMGMRSSLRSSYVSRRGLILPP